MAIKKKKQPKDHSDEILLDLYVAARSLAHLHRGKGGLTQHNNYSEKKAQEYRQEILGRMKGGTK